ncbi:biotin transport system substrate-specific component [Caldicoprobacter guelmensis]|uniref:biotin transporter BioY n=1 Tax=Caldicoprobacter guelmensis TaxID=1170224 RepID=UPI00195BB21C|nr:biotin transporter BioY [Caldicoprobacter guelmensis]MBM7583172.1 biotin transport system substrate-specific component [Caldicoprobacter guelmensis]
MTIRTVVQAALLATITAVLAQIAIPLPGGVPFTLQVFGVFLGILLLGKKAFWGMLTYLLLGAIGLPVFAQAQGGIGIILGPTGGYIIGFVISGLVGGYFVELFRFNLTGKVSGVLISLLIIYFLGTVQLAYVTKSSIDKAVGIGVLPFIPLDILKGVIAIVLSKYIDRALPRAGINING